MQFVFTYIRKPVGPGELWGRAACACRGASAALRRAGHSGAGQSGPSAAPAQPQRAQRCQGGTDPLLSGLGKKRKNLPGGKMEEQVCQADPRSCGVAEPGCGTGRVGARFALPAAVPCGTAGELRAGCGAERAVLRSSSRNSSDVPCAPQWMHLRFTERFSNFLSSAGTQLGAETGNWAEMLWSVGWRAANPQYYHPSISGERSSWRVCYLVFFLNFELYILQKVHSFSMSRVLVYFIWMCVNAAKSAYLECVCYNTGSSCTNKDFAVS